MKKLLILMFSFAFITSTFTGCKSALANQEELITLTMWHNYGGDMQQTMDQLIDEFNSTVGKEKRILINVEAISSRSELNKSLTMIANDDPGAPDMPDIFTGYPKIAIQFQEKDMLANLDSYFSSETLQTYVEAFVNEGRLSDGGLYVFPIAKSTEVLFVNQTLFDEFSAATGVSAKDLSTFEGIAKLSEQYYQWCGKSFYAADSWFNLFEVGMEQKGSSIFSGNTLDFRKDNFTYIFETFYTPAITGGIALYDGYSSDLSKTGDIICSTGSSAGILFYGDTITASDGTVKNVDYSILPYPVFEGGTKLALQRGGGLMVAKTNEKREAAACEFIKWLTAPEQNMTFVNQTGYLPVTKQAFESDMVSQLDAINDPQIKMLLTSVMDMYENYSFITAPNYAKFDSDSSNFEKAMFLILTTDKAAYLTGEEVSSKDALEKLLN